MYNIDCASSILLSFIRTTCLKDIDDYCKQKSVQLAIELDTLQKQLQNPSRNIGNISSTPSNGNPANDVEHDLHKKKEIIEKQLKAINTASKSLKELQNGTIANVDLVDEKGIRMNLYNAGQNSAETILIARAKYKVVRIATSEAGETHVLPLTFQLPTD